MVELFSVPAFFVLFRETLEAAIIYSVLLALVDKLLPREKDPLINRFLRRQLMWGTLFGLVVSLIIGGIFLAIFYTVAANLWEDSEQIWEGILSLIACVIITVLSLSLLNMHAAEAKWERKLRKAAALGIEKSASNVTGFREKGKKYALGFLIFTVVAREGLESVLFLGGIGFEAPVSSLPLAAITGLLAGLLAGFLLYKGGSRTALRRLLIFATVMLLFIAAALMVQATHEFEERAGTEYVLWELNCCDETTGSFWKILNIFGWRREATIGTTVAWFGYWVFVLIVWLLMRWKNQRKEAKYRQQELEDAVVADKQTPAVMGHVELS